MRNLTSEQVKAKRQDEIACRIAFGIAFVCLVFAIIQQLN